MRAVAVQWRLRPAGSAWRQKCDEPQAPRVEWPRVELSRARDAGPPGPQMV
jgi:hypothetical protein